MTERPTIQTNRLLLRPFTLDDAPVVQELAGERDIASNTLSIPHPYEDGMAEVWISTHQDRYVKGASVVFAIVLKPDESLIGAMGLEISRDNDRAELGYWIGKPYWNMGYCTEAARAVIQYGFERLGLARIFASHLKRNPASGRVMQKVGMVYEGRLRRHVKKWGKYEDLELYGILKDEQV
jgi:ribosomal-protein-alanine N-acetyltransferase